MDTGFPLHLLPCYSVHVWYELVTVLHNAHVRCVNFFAKWNIAKNYNISAGSKKYGKSIFNVFCSDWNLTFYCLLNCVSFFVTDLCVQPIDFARGLWCSDSGESLSSVWRFQVRWHQNTVSHICTRNEAFCSFRGTLNRYFKPKQKLCFASKKMTNSSSLCSTKKWCQIKLSESVLNY